MPPKEEAESSKILNVIDMAVTFTSMIRLFEKGSKETISEKLIDSLKKISKLSDHEAYTLIHADFCDWFVTNIRTAKKDLKNGTVKSSRPASYGHATKVFDIVTKVYVHYCSLPDSETAARLLPFLNGAIDNPIMKHLKSRYPIEKIKATTIESLELPEYLILQRLVKQHIKDEFKGEILPAQYDDVMWRRLNRNKKPQNQLALTVHRQTRA